MTIEFETSAREQILLGKDIDCKVTINKDIMLNLFNPQEANPLSYLEFESDSNSKSKFKITLDCDNEINIDFINDDATFLLPEFAEFKMFLWLWHFALQNKTRILTFNSLAHILNSLGYNSSGTNASVLSKMLLSYSRIILSNANFFVAQPINVTKAKTRLGNTEIKIIFSKDFWNLNTLDNIKSIDLKVITKLKSAFTIQLYLYFLKWSDNKTIFIKNKKIDIADFKSILGLPFQEFSIKGYFNKFKYRLNNALHELKEVDFKLNYSFDKRLYSDKRIRLLCFYKNPISLQRKKLPHTFTTKMWDKKLQANSN